MKWVLKEPRLGDIIRTKVGLLYHYGIYVNDEEIIQFGLSPSLRKDTPPADIAVCSSNKDLFLNGEFLEVGELESTEPKRFDPQKTVELARKRLGEKGYHILYNNCEHFANDCLCGKKVSAQTNSVREFFQKMPLVNVYLAEIPRQGEMGKVYPPARQAEIDAVSNEKVKREKYYVWKLLEHGLYGSFGKKIEDIQFTKHDTGKWTCNQCEFSLSHSHNLVCVAISRAPIGVDIEKIQPIKTSVVEKILSDKEKMESESICAKEKEAYWIKAWTKKESLFKAQNLKGTTFEEFKNLDGDVVQRIVEGSDGDYALSVATNTPDRIRIFNGIKLL